MTTFNLLTQSSQEQLIAEFFQRSAGQWRSERRYYTLPDGATHEVVSLITIEFLSEGATALQSLAQRHGLPNDKTLICGARVIWHSLDAETGNPKSQGSTLFGALGSVLYRDRGFATAQPVTAQFAFAHPDTLCLRTEYQGSVFEEELKLVGQRYRTRQTIISRAGQQQMIGQYLEKRLDVDVMG